MTTGTCVLAYRHASDTLDALASATQLSTEALGLLLRYLTRPPAPGTARADVAAAFGLSLGQLRARNAELAEAGYLLQVRRCVGRGRWQHLIVVVDTLARLPAPHEAWVLLDAALAAEEATQARLDTFGAGADVATCDDSQDQQAAACAVGEPIEPVNPFASGMSAVEAAGEAAVVATVAGLKRLAALPPLPAPEDQAHLWLTPGQVLGLICRYPPRYGELALGFLARRALPWYLAPGVVALLLSGFDTGQLGRALAGVEQADHPAAVARWRLDQLLLAEPPKHADWRSPSTYMPEHVPADPAAATARGAPLARAKLEAVRTRLRAREAAT